MRELEKHGQTTVSESGKRRWVVSCQKQLRMHLRKLNRDVCSSTCLVALVNSGICEISFNFEGNIKIDI